MWWDKFVAKAVAKTSISFFVALGGWGQKVVGTNGEGPPQFFLQSFVEVD